MRLARWLALAALVAGGSGCSSSHSSAVELTEATCPGLAAHLAGVGTSIPTFELARLRHFGIRASPTFEYADSLARVSVVRRSVSVFSCRDAGDVRAVELMEVSGIGRASARPVWVVYTTGVVQHSFGPGRSNGNPGVEFDFIDPHNLEPAWATTF